MRVGSLFSGIGGLDLGLERVGMEIVWQVEIDPFCQKVLKKHWPDVQLFSDVKEVGKHNLEPVDLICGGFPCQDISRAGRRDGIDGKESGLWAEFARVVSEVRPRYVLVENVPSILVRGVERVLGDLAALGYDAEWDCVPAVAVGAPHLRDRLFIVAESSGKGLAWATRSRVCGTGRKALFARSREVWEDRQTMEHSGRGRYWSPEGPIRPGWEAPELSGWWATEPDVGRVADGVPNRVDRLRALGNAVVPQVAEWIGRRVMEADND